MCNINASIFNPKIHVNIFNKLGNGSDLSLYCKSKDDDLGEHVAFSLLSFSEELYSTVVLNGVDNKPRRHKYR